MWTTDRIRAAFRMWCREHRVDSMLTREDREYLKHCVKQAVREAEGRFPTTLDRPLFALWELQGKGEEVDPFLMAVAKAIPE